MRFGDILAPTMLIFLTGAAGFIGSHLAERLCGRGDEVIGFDNFDGFYPRAAKERNLEALRRVPGFTLVEGDIRSADDLARALSGRRPDAVVHLAALAGVRPSLADPARYADVNVTGTQRVADAARAAGVTRMVFGSSSSVYGRDSVPPFKESDPCLTPLSPYAATKRANELTLFAAHHAPRAGRHLPALLHRLRPPPAARPGDPQVRPADQRRSARSSCSATAAARATTPSSTTSSTG